MNEGHKGAAYCWWSFVTDVKKTPTSKCEEDKKTLSSVLLRGVRVVLVPWGRMWILKEQRATRVVQYASPLLYWSFIPSEYVRAPLSLCHLTTEPCRPYTLAGGSSPWQRSRHWVDTGEQEQRKVNEVRWGSRLSEAVFMILSHMTIIYEIKKKITFLM